MTGLYALAVIIALYFVVSYFERRVRSSAVKGLVGGLTELRAVMIAEIPRKPAGADHPTLAKLHAHYDALTRELTGLGFRVLGDLEEHHADGTPVGITRWFVDAEGTSSGWAAAMETSKGLTRAVALFTEYAPPHYLVTRWGGSSVSLTRPPAIEQTFLSDGEPLTKLVVVHRNAIAQRGSSTATLVRGLDDAVSLMERVRSHANEWRARVPANDLLDQDLRAILGKHYKQFGPGVAAAMHAQQS